MTAQEQAFRLGRAWEEAPEPKRQFVLQIVRPDQHVETFRIGPHTPGMKSEDVHLVHRLWLNLTREQGLENLHHSDIVTVALARFAREYSGRERQDVLTDLLRVQDKHPSRLTGTEHGLLLPSETTKELSPGDPKPDGHTDPGK